MTISYFTSIFSLYAILFMCTLINGILITLYKISCCFHHLLCVKMTNIQEEVSFKSYFKSNFEFCNSTKNDKLNLLFWYPNPHGESPNSLRRTEPGLEVIFLKKWLKLWRILRVKKHHRQMLLLWASFKNDCQLLNKTKRNFAKSLSQVTITLYSKWGWK